MGTPNGSHGGCHRHGSNEGREETLVTLGRARWLEFHKESRWSKVSLIYVSKIKFLPVYDSLCENGHMDFSTSLRLYLRLIYTLDGLQEIHIGRTPCISVRERERETGRDTAFSRELQLRILRSAVGTYPKLQVDSHQDSAPHVHLLFPGAAFHTGSSRYYAQYEEQPGFIYLTKVN